MELFSYRQTVTMCDTDELIQNVIDTIDNACVQKHGLTEQINSLNQAKQQVTISL